MSKYPIADFNCINIIRIKEENFNLLTSSLPDDILKSHSEKNGLVSQYLIIVDGNRELLYAILNIPFFLHCFLLKPATLTY